MNKRTLWITLGTALILLLVIIGTGIWQSQQSRQVNEIKFGAILPLTGDSAFLGVDEQKILNVLQKELADRGQDFKIFYEDSKSTQKDSVSAYYKLRNEAIKYYLLSLTRTAEAVAPIGNDDKSLMLALSLHPTITMRSPYLLRFYYGTGSQLQALKQFIKEKGFKSVAVLYIDTPEFATTYLDEFPKIAAELGIRIVASEPFDFSGQGIRQAMVKIAAGQPDLIIAEDYGYLYSQILRNAVNLGVSGKLLGGIGFTAIPADQLNDFQGIPFIVPKDVVEPSSQFQTVIDKFKNAYGSPPIAGIDVYYTYYSVKLLADALQNMNVTALSDTKTVIDAWIKTAERNGFTIKNGAADFEAVVATYRDGRIVRY